MVAKKTAEKKKSDEGCKVYELADVLDITGAASFYSDIKEIAKPGEKIIIEAKNLEKITTPAIQILLSASNTVCSKKGSLKIQNLSVEMEQVFINLGLKNQLNEWK